MSHLMAYGVRMNSLLSRHARRSPSIRARRAIATAPSASRPNLAWIHDGLRHRATVWPAVRFEREVAPGEWQEVELAEDVFASAAVGVDAGQWRRALEFVPAIIRDFLGRFDGGRMAALHLVTRCPALLPELMDLTALTPFLTQHLSLRGGDTPGWSEISAVLERDGVYGVLQWLGLPASRQTLTILGHIADPDLPRWLLEPLRAALWEPEAIWALLHAPTLTDATIAEACHALAA